MKRIDELLEARNKIIEDQRAMLDKAELEKRDLSSEEEEQYDKMGEDFETLDEEIKELKGREERAAKRVEELVKREEQRKSDKINARKKLQKPDPTDGENRGEPTEHEKRVNELFDRYLINGQNSDEYRELRALQADKDVAGGFLVAPEQFVARLIKTLDNILFFRQFATTIPIGKSASLGAPALDHDPADPTWTAEIKTGTEDSTMDFEKRSLTPHPLAKRIKVSNKLLRISAIPVETLVRDRLAYKFGTVEENAFLNGDGGNKPLGVFVASKWGINTGQDVTTGNTSTSPKADGLIEAKYALKAQYRRNARWIFHRSALKLIRKLKDGEGQYIWRQGISSDRPDTILDLPFHESEYAPSTFTASQYVGIVGDFSFYWIVDALDMQVQVLNELYAESNQTGYVGRKETDGMPVIEEAFVRVKLAAS